MADKIDDGWSDAERKNFLRMVSEEVARSLAESPEKETERLRDYFAASALQGICASGTRTAIQGADDAYRFADAMLAARKKGGGT